MRIFTALMIIGLTLTACGPDDDAISFDGQFFNARLKSERGADRAQFSVTVRPVSASLEGAREAARYEATVYCVNSFGRSDVDWVVGPDDESETLTIENDTLLLQGRCREI
ncbi:MULTISPECIES: hypothetical protein [Roseobacter]|uniref:Lipoprotein n=2 Tax=Roseobacter litoralis TaxID=42443 RepID=F7ZCP3_ROSLO|nr:MULTISPECIES: hypothetical protein [Roseobacter]AEI94467.1 hypothetical protein RLO149_c024990 [Roseobacter litoralis Och 149]GIT87092.1 hypothetical protein ROBYS_21080 [Roseobacter sp. OBYS 0001]